MRTKKQWLAIAFITFSLMFLGSYNPMRTEASDQKDLGVGYIEDIAFEKMAGKERIRISISKQPVLKIEPQTANTIVMILENTVLRDNLKRPLGEGQLENIIRVIPYQELIAEKQTVVLKTEIKQRVPYNVRQEGQSIFLDFNLSAANPIRETPSSSTASAVNSSTPKGMSTNNGSQTEPERKITIDFQDANIKSVLRLLAETGGVNIVSGDDVKGNVTVSMKRIHWSQALDTVLKIQGLTKIQDGDVITIMTADRLKKEDKARKEAEDEHNKIAQQALIEQGKLRQVNIEAKIVEASEDFLRELGVQWGAGISRKIGSTPYGIIGGTNPSAGTNTTASLPSNIGFTGSNLAFNFPAATAAGTAGLGLIIGGTKGVLDAQLSALETNGEGKIISAPKVTTMDNVKATIKQGEEIPYVTYDENGRATVQFKEAVLKLEVTPRITSEQKISMTIKATNDRGNYARVADLNGNVPIIKNEIDSTVVISDGDTIVIGGVLKTEDTTAVSGVPWLHKIPFLGWLFKTENITKTKRHLLIFVTPRIINDMNSTEQPKA